MEHDGRPCIYLDTNVWIELAKGLKAGAGPWHDAAADLRIRHREGRIVLPLSSTNYRELWHRGSTESREQVGAVMRDLSEYATLGAIDVTRRLELDAYIERWFRGSTTWVTRSEVLGSGVNHAFASKYGRLRFVESLASDGVLEGRPVDPPEGWGNVVTEGPSWEWFSLVGLNDVLNSDGMDRTPAHRDGSAWAERELAFRRKLEATPAMMTRLWDLIVTQELGTFTDEINEACITAGVNPYGLFFDPPATDPPSAMRALVNGLPSVRVLATLRLHKHRDLSHPWEQHDLADLIALSTAVPYCDAVVTEKRWVHLVRASGLAQAYGTLLGSGVSGVRAALARADP